MLAGEVEPNVETVFGSFPQLWRGEKCRGSSDEGKRRQFWANNWGSLAKDCKLVGDRWPPAMIRRSICCSLESSTRCISVTKKLRKLLPTFSSRIMHERAATPWRTRRVFSSSYFISGKNIFLASVRTREMKIYFLHPTTGLNSVLPRKQRRFNENR